MSVSGALQKLASTVGDMLEVEVVLAPSSHSDLESVRKKLPVMSDAITEYLATTNGDSRIAFPFSLFGAKGVLAAHASLMKLNASMPSEHPSFGFEKPLALKFDSFWRPRWIPIAEHNNEDYFFIDLDPGPGGKVGQIGILESTAIDLVADSLEIWLNEIEACIVPPNTGENAWPDQVFYVR